MFYYKHKEFSLTKEQESWVVGIMLSVTLVKLLLVLYCRSFSNEIVKAYAQDHFFDVITNIIGLIAVILANYFDNWMDPVGAIIVSFHINKDKRPLCQRFPVRVTTRKKLILHDVVSRLLIHVACIVHNTDVVNDGFGERELTSWENSNTRVSAETDLPVLEPP